MTSSTKGRGSRIARTLALSGVALLLLAGGCSTPDGGDPKLSAKEDRSSSGALEALTVKGDHYTPNGTVKVTVLLAGSNSDAFPYFEEDIQAGPAGKFTYEKRPLPCPAGAGTGSWVRVVARDMSSQISASKILVPGGASDCKS